MTHKKIVLIRHNSDRSSPEFETASPMFDLTIHPGQIAGTAVMYDRRPLGTSVRFTPTVCRYTARPFYEYLYESVIVAGLNPLNTVEQTDFVSDLGNWCDLLGPDLTPRTWSRLEDLPEDGPYVLKGPEFSRRDRFSTHMYAKDKRAAIEVEGRLFEAAATMNKTTYIRQYLPLNKLHDGLTPDSLPISEEYRLFVLNGRVVDWGFYWSSYLEDIDQSKLITQLPQEFISEVIERIGTRCNFYTIDFARLASGGWTVIELNDGQMSGLSAIPAERFYTKLTEMMRGQDETT